MGEWRLIDIGLLSFSGAEIKRLPRIHAGFLVASSLAVSEINILLRLTLLAANSRAYAGREEVVQRLVAVDMLVAERLLSSKVVEYFKLIDHYQKRAERREGSRGNRFVRTKVRIDELRSVRAFEIARWFRDNITNHVLVSEIEKLLDVLPDDAAFPSYLHKKEGNSRYTLGEEITMGSKFTQFGDAGSIRNEWLDWMHEACREIISLHNRMIIGILEEFFPTKRAQMKRVVVLDELVADLDGSCLPLLWNFENAMDR